MLGCLFLSCFLVMTLTVAAAVSVPVPYIDLISPISAVPGGPAFVLTVRGTEFVKGATITWTIGSTTESTPAIFVSATEVQAQIPPAFIATAGTATVRVVNPAPIPTSNPVFFTIHAPFSAPIVATNYTVGAFSTLFNRPIGVGDFDGDGILDLAVGNAGANTVSIMKGSATGTFSLLTTTPVGLQPVGIVVADFNHDGNADLAVTDFSDGSTYILLGSGSGTFTTSEIFASGLLHQRYQNRRL